MGVSRSIAFLGLVAALAGCGDYPRDIEGTRDRVEAGRVVRVGLIGSAREPADRAAIVAFLDRVARATGASPRVVTGPAEPLLVGLQEDRLDLVIGEIAVDSPWTADVAVIEPLAERLQDRRRIGLSPVARNGENRWIMLLERLVRDQKGGR